MAAPAVAVARPSLSRRYWLEGLGFTVPALVVLAFTNVIPLGYTLYLSLFHYNLQYSSVATFAGLSNYLKALTDPQFQYSLLITGIIVTGTLLVETVGGFAVALLLARHGTFFAIARAVVLIPMVTASVVIGELWTMLLNPAYGPVDYLLTRVHLPAIAWLGAPVPAVAAIMIADAWQWTPFMILAFSAALLSVPKDILEASTVDGAGVWRQLVHIRIPILRSLVAVIVLLRLIDALKLFGKVFVMTQGGPGTASQVLTYLVYQNGLQYFNIGYGAAQAVLFILITAILGWIFIRQQLDRGRRRAA